MIILPILATFFTANSDERWSYYQFSLPTDVFQGWPAKSGHARNRDNWPVACLQKITLLRLVSPQHFDDVMTQIAVNKSPHNGKPLSIC